MDTTIADSDINPTDVNSKQTSTNDDKVRATDSAQKTPSKVECSSNIDNDERDLIEWNDDDDDKEYFNYDHNPNDNLIDEGSDCVSRKLPELSPTGHEMHVLDNMTASNVPFIMQTVAALNNIEQFNYGGIAPAGIQQHPRYILVPLIIKCDCLRITSNERTQCDDTTNEIGRLSERKGSRVNDNCRSHSRDEW